jgi:hypothetical protein
MSQLKPVSSHSIPRQDSRQLFVVIILPVAEGLCAFFESLRFSRQKTFLISPRCLLKTALLAVRKTPLTISQDFI